MSTTTTRELQEVAALTARKAISKKFGEWVKANRIRRGLTQPDLCDKLQRMGYRTSPEVLSRVESGKALPSIVKARAISEFLGAPIPKELVEQFERLDGKRYKARPSGGSKVRRSTFVLDSETWACLDKIKAAKSTFIISRAQAARYAVREVAASLPKLRFDKADIGRHQEEDRELSHLNLTLYAEDDAAMAKIIGHYQLDSRSEAIRLAARVMAQPSR